jgi:chromosome segregation ATPase
MKEECEATFPVFDAALAALQDELRELAEARDYNAECRDNMHGWATRAQAALTEARAERDDEHLRAETFRFEIKELRPRVATLTEERDRKQESNLVLLADAQRWQKAYVKVCDEKAGAEAALRDTRQALTAIAELGRSKNFAEWPVATFAEIRKLARAALAATGEGGNG